MMEASTGNLNPLDLIFFYFPQERNEVDDVNKARTEQNRIVIGLNSIYKGLLPKQHIKYKTK